MRLEYNFAKKEELDLIHEYSMRLLEKNGVKFLYEGALDIFRAHGFRVEGDTVYMGEKDVRRALETTPRTFDWYGRKSHVTIGGGKTICAPAYGPIFVLEDNKYHRVEKRDFLNFAKLHATSKVLDVSNPNALDFSFMPESVASNWAQATVLMHDERPAIGMVDGAKNARDSIQMAREFYGVADPEKVVVTGLISVASPCHYSQAMCEALIEYAKEGQGVFITPAALSGLTVPGSIASLLLVNNVEILSGIVLAQLINPGTPVIYGNQSHGCDLRYGVPAIGSPEQCLIFSAVKAFGDYYGLPVRTGGSSCDAKQADMQAGAEAFSTMYATVQSGADLMVHSCGSLDTDNSVSYDKFIYDEELLLSVKHMARGFEVNEDTLLYDCIIEAGPGGEFLTLSDDNLDACLDAYKEDYLTLQVPSHVPHALWVERGEEPVTARTKKLYEKRLAEYQMPELEPERRAVLEKYVPAELLEA